MPDKHLRTFLDGRPIGTLNQTTQGALSFTYDEGYAEDSAATPLSLSMPLSVKQHRNKPVRAFLDGLLPDSQPTRERWGRQYGVSPNNPFALLQHVGRDAAGAVQILPPGEPSQDAAAQTRDINWLSNGDFDALVRELAEHGTDWDTGRFNGRWSLAGAQSKVALFRDPDTGRWGVPNDATPTTHIIKPGIPGLDNHNINEALCQRAATELGLLAASSELIETGDLRVLISTRYDRRTDARGRWHRIHQEDLCQALGVPPSMKYQSDGGPGIGEIADLLSRLQPDDQRISARRFFAGLAFNILIGGADAHAKNYSLILIGRRAQIAPLYDLASAAVYPQQARLASSMKIGDAWKMLDVTNRDWIRVGRRLGIPEMEAIDIVDDLRQRIPDALRRALTTLPQSALAEAERMSNRISDHAQGLWQSDLSRPVSRGPGQARFAGTGQARPSHREGDRADHSG